MSLLALDIGNTNIKLGIFSTRKLESYLIVQDINEIKDLYHKNKINSTAICSVNPVKTNEIILELTPFLDHNPFIINRFTNSNLQIQYKTPETLGMDRICSLVGALGLSYKKLTDEHVLVTIDFGTATTINILRFPNIFIGGLIAPGIKTMFNSLNKQTAQLPLIMPENYNSIIGEDTNTSIASGVINSAVGMIEKVLNHLRELSGGAKSITFITGGMAQVIIKYLPQDFIYDPALVLKGIQILYDLNNDR